MYVTTRRGIRTALLAAFVCLATYATVQYKDSLTEESIAESVEDAQLPHLGPNSPQTLPAPLKASPPKVDVLANVIDLKAYCMAAYDEARTIMAEHKSAQALPEFVAWYGQQEPGVNAGAPNIVTQYSELMGKLHSIYVTGVNKYVLDHLDHAVRTNPEGIVYFKHDMKAFGVGAGLGQKFGHLAALRSSSLGLEDRPQIIVKMAIPHSTFLEMKTTADKWADNADSNAAAIFLQSKQRGQYQSFFDRELAAVEKRMRQKYNFISKSALNSAKGAYEESYEANRQAFMKHVQVQSGAAWKGSNSAAASDTWKPPSYQEMVDLANAKAQSFIEKLKANTDMSDLMKDIAEDATGVKVTVATAGSTDAQSTMKPTIKFVGEETSMEGELRSVPEQERTSVQHFPSDKALGKITSITLTGTGTDLKWKCKGLQIRAGAKDATTTIFKPVTGEQDGFWVKSGEMIELVPDKVVPSSSGGTCIGFEATKNCEGDEAKFGRDTEMDRDCKATIDGSMSGSCNCNGKKEAMFNCGHDSFNCEEICAAYV